MPKSRGEACPEQAPEPASVAWSFRLNGRRTDWDWSSGPPDFKDLEPYRRPASGAASRHSPVRAFSYTVGGYIELESGLEHDLLRVLDRDPSVTWLVPQPMRLSWSDAGRRKPCRHTPDLLSIDVDGGVTMWDVKNPEAASSSSFTDVRDVTQFACRIHGWSYEVFTGLESTHRHNLQWLHAYRRRPSWTPEYEDDVLSACTGGLPLGELVTSQPASERLAVVWHLMWTGQLVVDINQNLTPTTEVRA
ncbi:TnsA-like heteromeric transposase endonuclease subunit [Nocardioides sp. T5]|uniref:TnsA-like heteromeric transposase endonuclease subunit n=1 Tax=Nocardioides sp. T5 TaxID=3400182 RepID=UPI003A8A41CA